jgi:hypothetical protein
MVSSELEPSANISSAIKPSSSSSSGSKPSRPITPDAVGGFIKYNAIKSATRTQSSRQESAKGRDKDANVEISPGSSKKRANPESGTIETEDTFDSDITMPRIKLKMPITTVL